LRWRTRSAENLAGDAIDPAVSQAIQLNVQGVGGRVADGGDGLVDLLEGSQVADYLGDLAARSRLTG